MCGPAAGNLLERLLSIAPAERALLADLAADHPQPVLTYLANTLRIGEREIPYSTVAAIDFATEPPLGPFEDRDGKPVPPLADGEIALNAWAADDLGQSLAMKSKSSISNPKALTATFTRPRRSFRLAAILPLAVPLPIVV